MPGIRFRTALLGKTVDMAADSKAKFAMATNASACLHGQAEEPIG
jgi:hypothetical protein